MSREKEKEAVTGNDFHGYVLLMKTAERAGPERLSEEVLSTRQEEKQGTHLGGVNKWGERKHLAH